MTRRHKIFALIVSILIPQLIGLLSGYLTGDNMAAYSELIQPSFAPPGEIFGPVWAILYLLMGIASWLVYNKRDQDDSVQDALFTYALNLFFNFFWSILFFGLGLRGAAFIEILVLLVIVIMTTIKFYRIDKRTLPLMVPYIIWVAFAAVLNFSVWMLNM